MIIGGEQKRAVRVQVDPGKLAAMGLTLEDVRGALVSATVNAPKGTIDSRARSFTHLRQRPAHQGAPSTTTSSWPTATARRCGCATSATPCDGPENRLLAGWQNGKRGIMLVVFKQPGANVIDTVERIKAALPRAGGRRSRRRSTSA